jgi:hypothetical protein
VSRERPMPVRLAPALASVAAGAYHTCGLTSAGAAFCWGRNDIGQLGIGSQDSVPHPIRAPVTGNLSFASLDAAQRTCALTAAGNAYCWGVVLVITQGGVTSLGSPAPTPVSGGIAFRSVGVGPGGEPGVVGFVPTAVACGIATDGRGYCWAGSDYPFPLVGPVQP